MYSNHNILEVNVRPFQKYGTNLRSNTALLLWYLQPNAKKLETERSQASSIWAVTRSHVRNFTTIPIAVVGNLMFLESERLLQKGES